MRLPKRIGPIDPNGNKLEGIIYALKTKYNILNPVEKGIIYPSASSYGSKNINNTIVEWEIKPWCTDYSISKPYYQIYFPEHRIEVSGYSLRGANNNLAFPKKWQVVAFNNANKNNPDTWDVIDENEPSQSAPYCYPITIGCSNYNIGTFSVKRNNKYYHCRINKV